MKGGSAGLVQSQRILSPLVVKVRVPGLGVVSSNRQCLHVTNSFRDGSREKKKIDLYA